ncbi:MAG: hypothetical protein ACTJLK_00805 [Anaplasma sp.]
MAKDSSANVVRKSPMRNYLVREQRKSIVFAARTFVCALPLIAAIAAMSLGVPYVGMGVLVLYCAMFTLITIGSLLAGMKYASLVRSMDKRAPVPAVTGDGMQCFRKLILTPATETALKQELTQDRPGGIRDKFQPQQGRIKSTPHFFRSDRGKTHLLQVGGQVFEISTVLERSDIPHDFKLYPSSLSIQPHFLQGAKVEVSSDGRCLLSPIDGGFPYSVGYEVLYDKLLDRSIVMETMLGLRLNDDARLLKFSGDLLSGYVATYRVLLSEFATQRSHIGRLTLVDIAQFLQGPGGLKLAHDLVQYSDEFKDIETKNRGVPASDRDLEFIRTVRMVAEDMVQRDPDIKAIVEAEEGTSNETLRMLYMVTSPYMQFLRIKSGHRSGDSLDRKRSDAGNLTAHFLANSSLKRVLVSQTVKWALAAVDKYAQELTDENTTQLLVSKVLAQNGEIADSLPMVCTTVPGLVETVLCVVKAFKGIGNVTTEKTFARCLRQASLIPGFTAHGLSAEEARALACKNELFVRKSTESNDYVCAMAATTAITNAKTRSLSGIRMEDYLVDTLNSCTQEYERNHANVNYHSYVKKMHESFSYLEAYARRDGKEDYAYIQELVAHSVANTLTRLTRGEACSIGQLERIAESAPDRVGELLAKNGEAIHRRLDNAMFYTNIGHPHLISACVSDVDIGPKLKHLARFIKPDGAEQAQQQGGDASDDVADDEHPSSAVSGMEQVTSHAQTGPQQGAGVVTP